MTHSTTAHTLELVASLKLSTLLGTAEDTRLEASGICRVAPAFYVIFDNRADLACLGGLPGLGQGENRWLRNDRDVTGFEDVAFDPKEQHFYALVEAVKTRGGAIRPMVEEYDAELRFIERREVEFDFEHENKGFEGIAHAYRGDEAYLLLLCEGNACRGGKAGRTPGKGRIHVFRKGKKRWKPVTLLELPSTLPFEDYAALDVYEDWILVGSQASAAIWVGRMQAGSVHFVDAGRMYEFPRGDTGQIIFCNVEGVAWASENLLVAVSDRMKSGEQDPICAQHDQSVHIFRVPQG